MNLELRRDFTLRFVIVDVVLPIIGVGLLPQYGLILDCTNYILHDGVTSLSMTGLFATLSVSSVVVIVRRQASDSHLEEFPGLTNSERKNNKFQHTQRITPAQNQTCQARRLTAESLAVDKAEFDAMLRNGSARQTEGTCSSALHFVAKKDSVWRPCRDYRALNTRPSWTGIQCRTYRTTMTTYRAAPTFRRLTW
jgi:hypothetical protein